MGVFPGCYYIAVYFYRRIQSGDSILSIVHTCMKSQHLYIDLPTDCETFIICNNNSIFYITFKSDWLHLFAQQESLSTTDPGGLDVRLQSLQCRNPLKLDVDEALL